MSDIHDVYLQPELPPEQLAAHLRRINPEFMKRKAAGLTAAGQIEDIQSGPELARALRMQDMEMPGVVGEGFAAQGPTFLQGIATMAANRQGANQVNDLTAQAKALRAQTQDAQLAGMQIEDEAGQIDRLAKWEADEAGRTFQGEQQKLDRIAQGEHAKLVSAERIKMEELRQSAMRQGLKTWVNPLTGETKNASYAPGVGAVDERNEPTSIEGYIPFDESGLAKKHGSEFRDIPNAMKMMVVESEKGQRQLNRIAEIANTFDDNDIKMLNRAGLDLGVKIVSPKAVEEYLKSNKLGYSDKVRDYLIRVNDFASVLRHERFGSALTGNEIAFSEAFLPSATGIDLQERTARLNKYHESLLDAIRPIDNQFGTAFESRFPARVEFQVPDWAKGRKPGQTSSDSITPAMMQAWNALQAKNDEYLQVSGGKNLPQFEQMQKIMGNIRLPEGVRMRDE